MITQLETENRIVALMLKGARLIVEYSYHPDNGSSLQSATLECDGAVLHLANEEPAVFRDYTMTYHYTKVVSPLSDNIVNRPDVWSVSCRDTRGGYREVFEHKKLPAPRWVTEQWANPAVKYAED